MAHMARDGLDEIDREILELLMQDPRMPYSDIADHLEEADHPMSAEGVRNRVGDLFDESTIFLLQGPEDNDWEVIRFDVTATNEPGATEAVFDQMADRDFWLVCRGFGTIDVHGVATIPDVDAADDLVNTIRSMDEVDSVEYFLETERHTDMHNYMTD
mgnify:CR=1 FL=1